MIKTRVLRCPLTLHTSSIVLIATVLGSGCTNLGVKPWDRDLLADPMMEIGADALRISVDEHIYFSKEATSGGRGFAGGGCGCN